MPATSLTRLLPRLLLHYYTAHCRTAALLRGYTAALHCCTARSGPLHLLPGSPWSACLTAADRPFGCSVWVLFVPSGGAMSTHVIQSYIRTRLCNVHFFREIIAKTSNCHVHTNHHYANRILNRLWGLIRACGGGGDWCERTRTYRVVRSSATTD